MSGLNWSPLKLVNNLRNDKDTWNLCFVNATVQTFYGITEIRDYLKVGGGSQQTSTKLGFVRLG